MSAAHRAAAGRWNVDRGGAFRLSFDARFDTAVEIEIDKGVGTGDAPERGPEHRRDPIGVGIKRVSRSDWPGSDDSRSCVRPDLSRSDVSVKPLG